MPYTSPEDQADFQLKWVKGRRKKWLETNGPCAKCGSDRNLRPFSATRILPKNIWSLGPDRQLPILQQCIVLCASCHRKESLKRYAEKQQQAFDKGLARQHASFEKSVSFDPSQINVEGKEVVITITIKVV